jgi:hypothetical protein
MAIDGWLLRTWQHGGTVLLPTLQMVDFNRRPTIVGGVQQKPQMPERVSIPSWIDDYMDHRVRTSVDEGTYVSPRDYDGDSVIGQSLHASLERGRDDFMRMLGSLLNDASITV